MSGFESPSSFSESGFEAFLDELNSDETKRLEREARHADTYFDIFAKLMPQNLLPYAFMEGVELSAEILKQEEVVMAEKEVTNRDDLFTDEQRQDEAHIEAADMVNNRALEEMAIVETMVDAYIEMEDLLKTSPQEITARKGALLATIFSLRGRGIYDPLLHFVNDDAPGQIIDLGGEEFQVYLDEEHARAIDAATTDTQILVNGMILSDFLGLQTLHKYSKDSLDILCTDIAAIAQETPNKYERSSRIDEQFRLQRMDVAAHARDYFKKRVADFYPYED